MSTSEAQGVNAGPQLGTDVQVMLGDPLTIDIPIAAAATISLQAYDAEYLELNGARYEGANPGQDQGRFSTTFKTMKQGQTVLHYTLEPSPVQPLTVLVQFNVTIIGF
jgi:hypothetical protein